MFSKFKLDNLNKTIFSLYYEKGKKIYGDAEGRILCSLDDVTDENGTINGTVLQQSWFPVLGKFDVFLSHYHDDKNLAIGLAGFLKTELGLNVFIDSYLWGYSNRLLRLIDESYCMNSKTGLFDYDKRNYSTSHVHMMLSTALSNMINECEAIFFLNSSRETSMSEDINDQHTISPWIYNELVMSDLIKVRSIYDYRSQKHFLEHKARDIVNESFSLFRIEYDIGKVLKDYIPLETKDLFQCGTKWKRNDYNFESALDYIYLEKNILQLR